MEKRTHLTLLVIALSGIILGGCFHRKPVATNTTTDTTPPAAVDAEVNVSVVVDDGTGNPTTYPVETLQEATAFGALQSAAAKQGFTVDFDPPGQYGVFVKGIAGKQGDKQNFWSCSVNGQECQVASDKLTVKTGDTVKWTYTPIKEY